MRRYRREGGWPYDTPPFPNMFYPPLKAIPKDDTSQDIRLLLNLSYPYGHRVNQYEETKWSTYETLDCICDMIYKVGTGTLMYKFDVKSAYRHILIHVRDHHLLGFTWLGTHFYTTGCSFGGRHSYLWEELAQLIQ